MTPEEFKNEMADIVEYHMKGDRCWDRENVHRNMDRLMCDLLRELGYGEGVDVFELAPKWYA